MKRLAALVLLTLAFVAAPAQQGMGPGPGVKTYSAGASDFVTDSFTEGSDTTLASHTPEVGGTITKHPGAAYTSTFTIDAAGDEVWPVGTSAYYYAASPPSADYYVQTTVHAVTVENHNIGPCGHIDTSADTMICVRLNNGASWDLREISAGTGSTLATSTTSLPTAGQSKVVKLTFSVSGTKASVDIDGVNVIGATTITVTAAGKAGMRGSGGVSAATGFHLDNFSAR